ncbi:MAG: hypothetical protein ABIV04_19470 [Massilia sp.]
MLALADTMLASHGGLDDLVAACDRVFDAPLPWAPRLCAALLARTGEHFHYFSRYELTDILLQLLGRGGVEPYPYPDDDDDGDDDAHERAPLPAFSDLPPVRRY